MYLSCYLSNQRLRDSQQRTLKPASALFASQPAVRDHDGKMGKLNGLVFSI